MILNELHIINFKNIREADLTFADKLNCFVGNNGQGKTNLLDAIYYLSFTKSAFNPIDSQNILHDAEFAMIQGIYQPILADPEPVEPAQVTCAIRRGQKKQFRCGKKDYPRMLEHIGRIPLVMVSPEDNQLIAEGSDERRRFMDIVIGQTDRAYLEHLSLYNALLKQRNALLKQYSDAQLSIQRQPIVRGLAEIRTVHTASADRSRLSRDENYQLSTPNDLFEVLEMQMLPHAEYIFACRKAFVEAFVPVFAELYATIAEMEEQPKLIYRSQLFDRELGEAFRRTRQRDLILGWTSQGVHKDELEMLLGDYPLRRVGSQGQQKTYLIALKLAQALYLSNCQLSTIHTASADRSRLSRDKNYQLSTINCQLSTVNCQLSTDPLTTNPLTHKPILLLDDIFDKLDAERVARIVSLVRSDRFGQIFLTDTDRQHLTDIVRPIGEINGEPTPLGASKVFYVSDGEFRAG